MVERRSVRRILVVLAAASGLLLAACGSSGSESSGSSSVIKFMTVASVGSPVQNYPDIEAGARAAVKQINDNGGINGTKIKWEFCNTQADATKSANCYRTAVKDGAVALVGGTDTFSGASAGILEKAGIPEIGKSSTGAETDWTNSNSFPLQSGSIGMYSSIPYACAKDGKKTFAILALDIPVVIDQSKYIRSAAKHAGLKDEGIIKIPATGVTSYASYIQNLKSTGADCAVMILGPGAIAGVLKAAHATGLNTLFGTQYLSFGVSEAEPLGAAIAKNVIVGFPYPSPEDTSVSGIKTYNEELDAAGVKQDPLLRRGGGLSAWIAIHAAAQVAEKVTGPVTRASLTAQLRKTNNIDVDGLTDWDPAKTADPSHGSFARFPATEFNILAFAPKGAGLTVVNSPLGPIPDPIASSR